MTRYIVRSTYLFFHAPDKLIRYKLVNGCTFDGWTFDEVVLPEGTDDYKARQYFDIYYGYTSVSFRNNRVDVIEYRLDRVNIDEEDPSIVETIVTRKHSTMPSKREMKKELDTAEGRYVEVIA